MKTTRSTFHSWVVLLLTIQIVLDTVTVLFWGEIRSSLGAIFGFELGLLFFLNVLGVLLVFELLESFGKAPRWLRRYYRMPIGRWGQERLVPTSTTEPFSGFNALSRVFGLTLFFYLIETFVLPFLPYLWGFHCEAGVVTLVVVCSVRFSGQRPWAIGQRSEARDER